MTTKVATKEILTTIVKMNSLNNQTKSNLKVKKTVKKVMMGKWQMILKKSTVGKHLIRRTQL